MIKNITANYSVTLFFIYDASFFSYDTMFFISDTSFCLYDTVFFIYDASFCLYDTVFFIYDAVFFCLVMTFFLSNTVLSVFLAISVHFIAINGILSINPPTHNAKFPHRNIIRWGNFVICLFLLALQMLSILRKILSDGKSFSLGSRLLFSVFILILI